MVFDSRQGRQLLPTSHIVGRSIAWQRMDFRNGERPMGAQKFKPTLESHSMVLAGIPKTQ